MISLKWLLIWYVCLVLGDQRQRSLSTDRWKRLYNHANEKWHTTIRTESWRPHIRCKFYTSLCVVECCKLSIAWMNWHNFYGGTGVFRYGHTTPKFLIHHSFLVNNMWKWAIMEKKKVDNCLFDYFHNIALR